MKIPDYKAYEILKKSKIPIANFLLAKSVNEAIKASKKIKFPLVMKIDGDVIHKAKHGCVKIVHKKDEIARVYNEIIKNAKKVTNNIYGVIVQEFVRGEEIIIGAKRDPQFGMVVLLGHGGVDVKTASIKVAPLKKSDVVNMIKESGVYDNLSKLKKKKTIKIKGIKKTLPLYEKPMNAVITVVMKVEKLMKKNTNIKELDINPLFISDKVVAGDVRIIE